MTTPTRRLSLFDPGLLTSPALALPLNFALGAVGLSIAAARDTSIRVLLALAFGGALWTFAEYAIHRWLMHQTRTPLLRKLWIVTHRDHHRMRDMVDPSHRSLSVAISSSTLSALLIIASFVSPSGLPLAAVSGFALGFWWYETLHFAEHHPAISRAATAKWFARRQRLHVSHHFMQMNRNFGFTTSLWDRVFGTYAEP